jgi:hypothetical protein
MFKAYEFFLNVLIIFPTSDVKVGVPTKPSNGPIIKSFNMNIYAVNFVFYDNTLEVNEQEFALSVQRHGCKKNNMIKRV